MKFNKEKLTNSISKFSGIISNNIYIQAIVKGVTMVLPPIIIGSLFVLLVNIQFKPYQDFITSIGLKDVLAIPNSYTMGIVSLLLAFTVSYNLVNSSDEDGVASGILSICSFLILIPLVMVDKTKALPTSWLGTTGMFTAMLVALISGRLFLFLKQKGVTIKMPEEVPEATVRSFSALIPGMIIIGVFLTIRVLFGMTPYQTVPQAIFAIIQMPLQGISDSVGAIILIYLLSNLVWFFGIHGIVIVSLVEPLLIALDLENIASPGMHLVGKNFTNVYAGMSGAGITIGLVILMLVRAKSAKYRTVGKISIIPSIFCINEPVIFGVPIIYNAIMIIPFILTPIISIIIAYILTSVGILPVLSGIQLPWSTPAVVLGFMLGGWRVALYQIGMIGLSILIYSPFFRIIDNKAYLEEHSSTENAAI